MTFTTSVQPVTVNLNDPIVLYVISKGMGHEIKFQQFDQNGFSSSCTGLNCSNEPLIRHKTTY